MIGSDKNYRTNRSDSFMKNVTGIIIGMTGIALFACGCGELQASGVSKKSSADSAASSLQEMQAEGTPQQAFSPVTKQSFYFDTIVQITVYAMNGTDSEGKSAADNVIDEAFKICSSYEKLLSKTKEGSDIWNINHAGGQEVQVDPETLEVIQKGISYGDLSEGRFDITIGTAEDLWDFHSDNPHVPKAAALSQAVRHVDYRKIHVDDAASTVRLDDPQMEIDLGGIAKGYIADRVCDCLKEEGVTSAIVSLGGNIETVGGKITAPQNEGTLAGQKGEASQEGETNQEGEASLEGETSRDGEVGQEGGTGREDGTADAVTPFTIGIETPYSDMSKITGSVQVIDGTVVTSGVYERYFTEGGKEYHHILDPGTGYPVETDILGATIQAAAGHSADSDALSTICLILGSQEGKTLIEEQDGYEAVFILKDSSVVTTSGIDFSPVS